MLVTKLDILIFFTLLFGLNGLENQHFKCPNMEMLLKFDALDEDFNCAESLFYDDQAGKCVALEECPMMKDLIHFLDGGEGIDFQSLAKGDIVEFSKNILTNFNLMTEKDFEKYEDEKDFDLIRNVLDENVGSVLYKYIGYLNVLGNPYLRSSSFIKRKCGDDTFCFLKYMLGKNKKQVKKAFTDFLPDLVSGFGDIKEELQKTVLEECEDDECKLSKTFIEACEEVKGKINEINISDLGNYLEQLFVSKKSEE